MADGPATISVRPERIVFSDTDGLAGTVKARIFQGHHWLLHVAIEAGLVLVIAPNDGRAIPAEGSTIRLAWRAEDMTLTRAESAP
jgi:putative spermidine/putrescine transport system ATP-binding protein